MKNGVDAPEGTRYTVNDLSILTTNYAELALGHARQINDQWTVGAKMKFLVGLAKATVKIDRLDIEATPDAWKITPSGAQAYLSAKVWSCRLVEKQAIMMKVIMKWMPMATVLID